MISAALLYSLSACQSQYVVEGGDEEIGSDTPVAEEEEDTSMWDGATMVVTSPLSGSFLPYEEAASFSAVITGADGVVMEFDDITWLSDVDAVWALTGAALEDATLDVGTHALTATAILPNGNRLAYSVGGVLVQSAYTGIYTGTLQVNTTAAYNGTEYAAGCSGAITLVVDAYGDTATGDAGCLLSLLGYELDTSYVFDLENDGGTLSGDASLDLSFYQIDIGATGTLTEEGAAELTFSQDVYGYLQVDGAVDATRVSRDISAFVE